jgi:4-hydroxybenzoate polyprenyltransferase
MRILPYAQLLRIPNVFTAFADILLGTIAAGTLLSRPIASVLLLLASGCLYCAGMVWNDVFDLAEDRRDRPFRPIPSGRVSLSSARWIGFVLLLAGLVLASAAGWDGERFHWPPTEIALVLVAAILLYDSWLKRTPVGPLGMAVCRFLNVLLGLSLADAETFPWNVRLHLALVVGLYIVGVTWFARSEAGRSNKYQLRGAAAVMLAALLLALAVPVHRPEGMYLALYPFLLVGLGFLIALPVVKAIEKPEAANVQAAVKRCIFGLVILDAVLATAFVGPAGLLIILLLLPGLWLGHWVYST